MSPPSDYAAPLNDKNCEMLRMTRADLSVSLCVYFYLRPAEREMMYQWRTYSPALWIKMTGGFFKIFPSGQEGGTFMLKCLFCPCKGGREGPRQAYIKLFLKKCIYFIFISLFLFPSSDETPRPESGHFEERVPVVLRGCLLSGDREGIFVYQHGQCGPNLAAGITGRHGYLEVYSATLASGALYAHTAGIYLPRFTRDKTRTR